MKKQTIYIAGPMTGLPDLNFPAFRTEAARLRALGWEVINPAEINPDKHLSWRECMMTDIAALVFCDAVQLLPGWDTSKGATLEHHIADRLGLIVYPPAEAVPAADLLRCDYCGAPTDDPWHSSVGDNRHVHSCDACHKDDVKKLPTPPQPVEELTPRVHRLRSSPVQRKVRTNGKSDDRRRRAIPRRLPGDYADTPRSGCCCK